MRKALPAILALFFTLPFLHAQTAEEILGKFAATIEIPTIQGTFTIRLISAAGDVREIKARAYQKMVGAVQNNRLFVFDFPPTVRGTGLLIHSYTDGRPNDMWIYLPTIKRVKRIALESSGGGYFMGSDFSYQDLINTDYNKMAVERVADQTVYDKDSYVIKAWGRTPEDRQEHGYLHILSYYRKDNYLLHRRDYFDFNGDLLKTYKVEDFLKLGPYMYPTVVSMTNVQTQHRSELRVDDVKTVEIPDNFFTTRYLQTN